MAPGQATAPANVVSIHIAPASRLPMRSVPSARAEQGRGLVGDRYHGARHRHVSVQSAADLEAAGLELGSPITAGSTRRNVTLSAGSIPSTPGDRLRIGEVQLEVVRIAAPCKLLDDVIGTGAKAALRRRAGSICRVLSSGTIAVGDDVDLHVAT